MPTRTHGKGKSRKASAKVELTKEHHYHPFLQQPKMVVEGVTEE